LLAKLRIPQIVYFDRYTSRFRLGEPAASTIEKAEAILHAH